MNSPDWLSILAFPSLVVAGMLTLGLLRGKADKRARPDRKLLQERNRLRELLELASDWRWETDDAHCYTDISAGFEKQTGEDPQRLIGRAPWESPAIHATEQDWTEYRRRLDQHERTSLVFSHKTEDNRIHYYELVGSPVFKAGVFVGYHGIGRSVTSRVSAERALNESEQRYHDVVESVIEVIFQTDPDGRLSFLNGVWHRLTGHTIERSLGRPFTDFLHPDDCPGVRHMLAQIMSGEISECTCQTRLRTRKGEIRWIEASGRPLIGSNGEIRGIAGTLDDISSRKVAELTLKNVNQELESRVRLRTAEMEAANRELEAFSYSVSHDLRAPLRAIDGFARILEEDLSGQLTPATTNYIERIRRATHRMAHLIDALIELARLTRQSVHKEAVNLSELALQIIDEIRSEEPERKVEFEVTREMTVSADRVLVRVMLENLLRNAWKFSAGKPDAKISFGVSLEGERRVFCVEDNGAGFDMAFAASLFRPFSRLHNSAEFAGTGIGLATVQRIIQRHGGSIRAEAEPGRGARFFFTL
ncbi:sensor histidine kinase [Parazoarcus communis]|nr:PAS domain S-box protein [Parazoarcus communis]